MAVNDTTPDASTIGAETSSSSDAVPSSASRTIDRQGNPVLRFIRESRIELRKVTWPTREQVINLTIVVVVVCAVMAVFLGVVDYVFTSLIQTFIV